jgi:hypothetical protein
VGLLLGTVGVELFYRAIGHWSRGRYDAIGWLFVPVLVGLGVSVLVALPSTRRLAWTGLGALVVGELAGLAAYARVGRPDWDRVGAEVQRLRRPGEPVLVENGWTLISLGYYLQGRDFLRRSHEDGAPQMVPGGPRQMRAVWAADRAAILVIAAQPHAPGLGPWARHFPVAAHFAASDARVFVLAPEIRQRLFEGGVRVAGPAACGAPAAAQRAIPRHEIRAPAPSWLEALQGPRILRYRAGRADRAGG